MVTDHQALEKIRNHPFGDEIPKFVTEELYHSKAAKKRLEKYRENPHLLNFAYTKIAEGVSVRELADELGVKYSALYALLRSDKCKVDYDAARAAYAESLVDRNMQMADSVELGLMDPTAATSAAKIRQWYAERANRDAYGAHSSVDMRVNSVVSMHIEAVRALSDDHEAFGHRSEEIVDAEIVEEEQDEPIDLDHHPLL